MKDGPLRITGSPSRQAPIPAGHYVFALGIIALGVVCLAARDVILGQPLPDKFSYRTASSYAAASFMLPAGAAIFWRRATPYAAASLTAFYAVVVVILIDIPYALANPASFGTYSSSAEGVAVAAAALLIFAATASLDAAQAARLTRLGQTVFGVCAVLFGFAHFVYMDLTVPLVPKYLPPSQTFWAIATGIFHIAAGVAILTRFQARAASILLTIMYASFTPLVHVPMLLADPTNHFEWTENAFNLALTGAAWVVASSYRGRKV
jgi:uncharacterized membrane protein